jgi:hypothetical protein
MEQTRFEFILRAVQPIAHHSESLGNISLLMRRKIRQTDGSFAQVPIVTGDTMRHGMREASTYALLDAAGLLRSPDLSEAALRLLFSGGMITGSSGGAVKLGDYREMVDLIPPLALFGGCAQNRAIPGRLFVDDALLICVETYHLLPEWALEWVAQAQGTPDLQSCRAHVEEETRVRMDPTLDPGKRRLLTASSQGDVSQRMLLSEEASGEGDVIAKDRAKSTMLPRSHEVVVSGSLFHWAVTATCYDDLDRDTFLVSCAAFLSHARVGGKKATGHGLVIPVAGYQVSLGSPAERTSALEDPQELGVRCGSLFRRHVIERAEKISDFLRRVAA